MNLSGSGVSWTLGPRGASIGIGKRGSYLNAGIPGSGLHARHALATPQSRARARAPQGVRAPSAINVALTVSVSDDGSITFQGVDGRPVSDEHIARAKKQQGDAIKALIQAKCDEINAQVAALGELHHHTPSPDHAPNYQPAPFHVERPAPPILKAPGFLAKLFKPGKIEAENARALLQHEAAVRAWEAQATAFQVAERQKQDLVARAAAGNVEAMETFFGEVLQDIAWPRETLVSFEVRDAGTRLSFDVDLPEIADMPCKVASAPQRGYKLKVKALGPAAVQKMYAQHVHSIAFRLVGEAFAMLPTVGEVTLSAYSQCKDRATGHERDEYLLSVTVSRSLWRELNFVDLSGIDVLEAFTRFRLRRAMTKTGVFSPVQPF
jgi:hypothetical protein